jgi:DHA1 family bicyclomycin/chloramphenicol resistance-like MFS transporter
VRDPTTAAPKALTPTQVIVFVAGASMLLPLSTDLYQPALPSLAVAFGVAASEVQLTLTAFVLAFGLWQLAAGPLADRFGRYPVLLGGVAVYATASAFCAAAPSIEALAVARVLQGIGACSCAVAARAIVRDLHAPADSARVLAAAGTWMSLAPLAGPPLGGLLLAVFGWRSSFVALCIFGLMLAALAVARLRETLPPGGAQALRPRSLLAAYAAILRAPSFNAYAWPAATSYAALFAFISGGSFALIRVLGLSPAVYGLGFSFIVSGYLAGTLLCRRIVGRAGLPHTLSIGAALQAACGLAMAVPAALGVQQTAAILLPMFGVMVGHGLIQPIAQAGTVAKFPRHAGTATALMGAIMMGVAATVGQAVAAAFDGTVRPLAFTVAAAGAASALLAATVVRRHGHV